MVTAIFFAMTSGLLVAGIGLLLAWIRMIQDEISSLHRSAIRFSDQLLDQEGAIRSVSRSLEDVAGNLKEIKALLKSLPPVNPAES